MLTCLFYTIYHSISEPTELLYVINSFTCVMYQLYGVLAIRGEKVSLLALLSNNY